MLLCISVKAPPPLALLPLPVFRAIHLFQHFPIWIWHWQKYWIIKHSEVFYQAFYLNEVDRSSFDIECFVSLLHCWAKVPFCISLFFQALFVSNGPSLPKRLNGFPSKLSFVNSLKWLEGSYAVALSIWRSRECKRKQEI